MRRERRRRRRRREEERAGGKGGGMGQQEPWGSRRGEESRAEGAAGKKGAEIAGRRNALRVSPAVTRLTVYRRPQITSIVTNLDVRFKATANFLGLREGLAS